MNADTVRMVAHALLKPTRAAFLHEGSIRDFLLSSGTCPLENATLPEELIMLTFFATGLKSTFCSTFPQPGLSYYYLLGTLLTIHLQPSTISYIPLYSKYSNRGECSIVVFLPVHLLSKSAMEATLRK